MRKTTKEFITKYNLTEDQFFGKEKICGDLGLRGLTSIPEGFNPTVGGDLLTKNKTKRIGFIIKPIQINRNFFWKVEGKTYAKIDGIFCEIISEKENNIKGESLKSYSAKKVNREDYFFIAKKGNYYSHSKNLKTAFEDLEFKIISEKLKNDPINKDTEFTVKYYRLLTGACDFGCREFMDKHKIPYEIIDGKTKENNSMKAETLLPLLEKSNAYGLEKFKKLITF